MSEGTHDCIHLGTITMPSIKLEKDRFKVLGLTVRQISVADFSRANREHDQTDRRLTDIAHNHTVRSTTDQGYQHSPAEAPEKILRTCKERGQDALTVAQDLSQGDDPEDLFASFDKSECSLDHSMSVHEHSPLTSWDWNLFKGAELEEKDTLLDF